MTSLSFTHRIDAVLACLRGEVAYETVAQQFNVSVDEVRRWESTFIAGGTSALGETPGDSDVGDYAHQIHEAQSRVTEMGALNAISQSLTAILDLDELLNTTISTLYWVFGYTASITLVEGMNLVVKTGFALNGEKLPPNGMKYPISGEESITAWAAANGRPLHVPDTSKDARYVYRAEIGDVRSEEAMPILFKGTVLGVLTARSARAYAFGPRDTSLLETIAFNLAIAIENALLFEAVRRRVAQLELVQSITAKAIQDPNVESLLDFTVRTTCALLDYSTVAIGLLAEDRQYLDVTTVACPLEVYTAVQVTQIPVDRSSPIGLAAIEDRLLVISNGNEKTNGGYSVPLSPDSPSILAVPIRSNGVLIGVISVESSRSGAFDDADIATLTILADQLTNAIRGAQQFQQIQAQFREISMFRRLADEAIVGIMTRSGDGLVDYSNPTAAALFGYPDAAAMHGTPLAEMFAAETWNAIDQQLQQGMSHSGWSGEITQQRRDGRLIVCDISIFPIHAPDDTFMSYGMVLQDATERHRLLDAIQQANARFEAVLDTTDDGVIVWDEFWRVLLVNPAACRLLNARPDELLGCTSADWQTQPHLAAAANAQDNERIEFPGDKLRVGRCRNLRWISDRGSGYLTLISDITSEIELEQAREQVMSMLLHDLVSPLTSLVGGIEIALELYQEGVEQKRVVQFLNMGSRNGRLLLTMINSLLDIMRLEAGRLTLQYSPLDLKAVQTLFEEVIGILANSAQSAQITVTSAMDDHLPSLMADYSLLRRTLTNLLDNAIKFTPDGGRIELSVRHEGDHMLRFSVSDTGPGVPENYRKKLFERYAHVPGVEGRRMGTGLGLVFCRLVAEAHHGSIWVEPGAAGGSVFHFTVAGEAPAAAS